MVSEFDIFQLTVIISNNLEIADIHKLHHIIVFYDLRKLDKIFSITIRLLSKNNEFGSQQRYVNTLISRKVFPAAE